MPMLSHEVSNAYSTLYVHFRTSFVHTRTEINIPHINFNKDEMGPGPVIRPRYYYRDLIVGA
jgi:hypothetical protein